MTTSQTSLLSEIQDWSPIPEEKLVYFRTRLKLRLYSFLLAKFAELEKERDFSKAKLAARIGKDPALITRWLGNPGNLRLDTLSDLLLGMKRELLFTDSEINDSVIARDFELWVSKILDNILEKPKDQVADKPLFPNVLSDLSTAGKAATDATPNESPFIKIIPPDFERRNAPGSGAPAQPEATAL